MMWLKSLVYRLGFRPVAGKILYSPSLAIRYSLIDAYKNYIKENK